MIQFGKTIPVTIRPAFWIMAGIIGFINSFSLIGTLIWIGIIFVSIYVHEMGHAITSQLFGQKPRVELLAFGGDTYPEGPKIPRWKEFIVVLDGPLFGFGLFALATLLLYITGVSEGVLFGTLKILQIVNLFWTAFNLIPIFPLDGGQLLRIALEGSFGAKGFRYALAVGMGFGFTAAIVAFIIGYFLIGAFFFIFAFQNVDIWRRSKNLTEADRDETVQSEVEEVEKLLSSKRKDEAAPVLESLIQRTKRGVIFQRASELLADIYFEREDYKAVYELLEPLKKDLTPPARPMLHKAAFEMKDYPLVLKMGTLCFQEVPSPDIAITNALAASHLGKIKPTIGWLESALEEGAKGLSTILEDKAFDSIRDHREFKKFITNLQ